MARFLTVLCMIAGAAWCGPAEGRGFGGGGYRGGSFGGYRGGSFGGYGGASFGGYRSASFGGYGGYGGSYSASRSFESGYGYRGGYGATGSYNRSWNGANGGSVDVSGTRGAAVGPWGGFAAGGTRDVTATGPNGRSYSSESQRGVAAGPYGGAVAGGSREWGAGAAGTARYAGARLPTDLGWARYGNGVGAARSTVFWSGSSIAGRAALVRSGYAFGPAFNPGWYAARPGAWLAAGWAAGAAWNSADWAGLSGWCGISAPPVYYDFGNTVVYQGDNVTVDGMDAGTAADFSAQATAVASQGQAASATPDQAWLPLGVFALVRGEDSSSHCLFQLAANKQGVIRGNFYDGVADTTTPVFGSIDPATQRAAWTIGKATTRVFDSAAANLTKPQAPVLVHLGPKITQQWLLVRMPPQPAN